MSIFPKRTISGQTVTIHWNFNVSHLHDQHAIPYVKLGVKAPNGSISMLYEGYVIGLPTVAETPLKPQPEKLLYLNKNTPLLMLTNLIAGRDNHEELLRILENIQSGRHFYFSYCLPNNAEVDKYTLISEVYRNGQIKYSSTQKEDYFFVEKIDIISKSCNEVAIVNTSRENCPIKILHYTPTIEMRADAIDVLELKGKEIKTLKVTPNTFLVYNEERIVVPLYDHCAPRYVRNQQLPTIEKNEVLYVLQNRDSVFELNGLPKKIWLASDGISTMLTDPQAAPVYEEMEHQGLIHKIIY